MPNPQDRPLSPHVGIYRWQLSNGLSILHRATGFGLSFGLILLTVWIWAVAYDPVLFDQLQQLLNSVVGRVFLFAWTIAFFYHFGNGIRHLFWDTGRGLRVPDADASGKLVLVFTACATIFTWALIVRKAGLW